MKHLRFRSVSEANQALNYLAHHQPIPPELMLWPYVEQEGWSVPNPEYTAAPYELQPFPISPHWIGRN